MTTARTTDQNGYIEIKNNPISRVGIYQYEGEMIGGDSGRIYNVLRSAEELSRPETLDSLRLMPFTDGHMMLGSGETDIENFPAYGTTGEEIHFDQDDGTLYANIKIWSQQLMDKIDTDGIKEISAGYKADHAIFEKEIKADYEFADGEFDGQPYDAIQVNIRFNHVALVENGRMGSTVKVLDQADITGAPKMTHKEKLAKVLSLLQEFMEEEDKEPENEEQSELEPDKGTIIDADCDKDEIEDEFPADLEKKDDEEEKDDVKDEDEANTADKKEPVKIMDSAMITKVAEMATLRTIRTMGAKSVLADKIITAGVGVFDHAEMSIDAVAKYGVKKLGLKCPKGQEQTALDFYFAGLQKGSKSVGQTNVMDSFENDNQKTSIDLKEFA